MKELLENYNKLSEEKQKLVKLLLKEKGIDINAKVILRQNREKQYYPLSYAQQRLWFLEKLEPNSPLYIIPSGVKILGELSSASLLEAIQKIAERHEILRTRFIEKDGIGFQEILSELKIEPIYYDLINFDGDKETEINLILQKEFNKPFDLSALPLFRFIVIRVEEKESLLLLPMHHIISDNWSTGILIKEIIELYNHYAFGCELTLPPINVQYLDYSIWQKEWLSGEELKNQKEYWIDQLNDSNEILEIIPDKKRPALQTYNGSFEIFQLDSETTFLIDDFCKKNDITPFVLLLAAYQFLLSKYSNQNDINTGVPIANRNRAEIEELIGFFINTLVLRNKIDESFTVKEYLDNTKEISLNAFENQDIPFEMIVDELGLERDMSHTALFQSMFVLNNAPMTGLNIKGLEIAPIEYDTGKTKFDLVLSLTKTNETYSAKLEYNTDLFIKDTIRNISNQFIKVLKVFISESTSKLKDIVLADHIDLAKSNSRLVTELENYFVHEKFRKVARENPDKVAISDGANSYSYKELDKLSDYIAHSLIKKGIKPEQSVGIFLNRKIEYVASILAIFKSGGVFVPLDVNLPKDRLEYIIDNADIKTVITEQEFIEKISFLENSIIEINSVNTEDNFGDLEKFELSPNNAAYIIYTSGSTGLPKGVVVEHTKFCYHITQMISEFGIFENDKYLAFAAFNFDPSLEQIFVPLLAGAEVYLRDDEYWIPNDFIELIKNENISVINPPTIYWNQFVLELIDKGITELGKLRLVIAGGEEMKPDFFSFWINNISNKIRLINAYGPTETVITSTVFSTHEKKYDYQPLHVPIGKPTCGRSIYIMDRNNNKVPTGMPGELCFGGELLSRGYKNEAAQTAEKFVPNPYSSSIGDRIYKTGDLVRADEQGYIEYLGRIDNQVKIRGFRIELGDIEEVLLSNPLVDNAIVNIVDNENTQYLFGYIVTTEESYNEEVLIKFCKDRLPNYMIPTRIINIEEIPLNSNGKLDKNKLPIPNLVGRTSKVEFIEPRSELEKDIAEIVCNTLNIEQVGVYDNFFEIGGHSILAIKVISEVRERFGVNVELKSLFENPTVEGLSEEVVAQQSSLIEDEELESLLGELEELNKN